MIKTSATQKRCPKFDSHMQAHCGYATAALGSGPLPCRPISSGRDRAALFFKALNAILDGHPPCQALGSASGGGGGGGEGFPSKSGNAAQTKGCLQPVSLNLFTGRPLLRATVASSEKKTIFGRRVSSIRTTGPIHRSCAFMMSASMQNMLALRRNAHDLASATEVKLIQCYNDFCRASKSHSHRAEKR